MDNLPLARIAGLRDKQHIHSGGGFLMTPSGTLKKSLITAIVVFALVYSLAACGGGGVANQAPVGQLTAELYTGPADLEGPVGTRIRFTAIFRDPDGGNVVATIDFGDGSNAVVPVSGNSLIHTYTAAGTYQPRLLLQDDDNTPVVTLYVNNDSSYRVSIENRAPVAIINAAPTSGPKPLAVSFNGSNSYDPDGGLILNYFWTFNSGGPNCPNTTTDQTGATASYVYESEGQFYACLRVTDDEGQTSYATQLIVVRDRVPPTPVLQASPTSGITPLVVTFNGGSSFDPDNGESPGFGITSYEWKFEASPTDQCATFVQDATGPVTQHTYVNNGPRAVNFTAILRVRDDDTPVANFACGSVTITVQSNPPPIANISANPTRGPVPLTVSVNGSASYDPDGGSIVLFEWDFASDPACTTFTRDQTGATAQWTYTSAGTFFICLRVTDDEGLTSTTVQQINAGGNPPVAVINANPTWSNDSPLTVFFDGRSSYDPEGLQLVSYVWDFGDNSPLQSGATAQHTYTCPDALIGQGGCTWTATLTVTDPEGLQNTAAQVIVISANPAPVAVLTADPTSGTAPLQVTFDASASHDPDPTNVITSYVWSGTPDGCALPGGSSTFSFSCTFDTNGIWTITVTVTDDEGLTDSNTVQIFVGFNPPPVAVFSANPSNGPQPLTVSFDATASYDPDGGTITLYEWDFTTGGANFVPGSATTSFVYTCPGSPPCTFTSALRVTDDDAPAAGPRTNTTTRIIYVGGRAPVAIINAAPTWSNHSPMTVNFNGSASFDPDGLPLVSYTWNFGDGSPTQTGATASHTYYASIPYCSSITPPNCTWFPTLTVVDREGLSDTATQTIIISNNPAPIAILTATPTWGGNPLNVTFDGTASHDPDPTNILTYSWSPPVGGCTTPSTSIATFSCLFNVDGAHTVTLTVTDDEALSDSATVTIFVNTNPPPIAVINAPATTCMLAGPANSCVLTFLGGNSFDPDNGTFPGAGITLYEWDTNGDFTIDSLGSTVTQTYFAPGPVVVTLQVTDDDSNVAGGPFTDIESIVVTILGNPDPVAMVSCQPTYGIAAFSFTCTGIQSHDPDATNVITLYDWEICAGSGIAPPCSAPNVTPTTGTGVIYTATFDSGASGVYTVNLEVTDDEGNTDTEQAILNVGPNPPPIAVATASPSFCTAPCDVTLDGSGSYDPDATNTIIAYSWVVSGPDTNFTPSTSTDANFVVHFNPAANGVYTAQLTVTDDEGLTDGVSVSIYINLNPPPVAVLTAPATACMIHGVLNTCILTFSGQDSYDPDEGLPPSDGQGITNYEWDPDGDGLFNPALNGSTTITWTYGFADVGTLPVSLRVTDNDGLTNTAILWVTILGNPDPVAAISCTPTFGTAPFTVTCHGANSSDPDATNIITDYAWSISPISNVDPDSFNGLIYTFTFDASASGVYTVKLTVTDDEGNTDVEFATINVGPNPPPIAVATATPSFCQAPCNITLDGTGSSDPDSTNVITSHQWGITGPDTNYSVPGGVTVNGPADPPCTTPTDPATFAIHFNSNAAGVYTAELAVCDDDNLSDTVSVSMYINVNPPPVAVLGVFPTSCTLTGSSLSCSVTADGSNSYDPDNTTGGISNYAFDCDGDGTAEFSGLASNVVCTYTAPGTYVLILTVTDDDTPSQTDTASSFVTVFSNPPPVAVIESDRTQGGEPLTVAFTGLSSYDPDATNTITAYSWDFNDTGSGPEVPADCTDVDSTDASPSHTFPEVGTYLVCLTVTDEEGLTNTAHLQIIVGGSDIPPVAVLNALPIFGDAPLTVAFDATGSHDPDNANPPAGITMYEYCFDSAAFSADCNAWSSPDASGATLTSVNNTYNTNGPYVAKLRVTDDEGSTNVASILISVGQNPPPIADIQASPTTCVLSGVPLTCAIALDACASDDPDNPGNSDGIVDYSWDFNGDGDYSDLFGVEFSSPASEGSTGTTCSQTVTYILPGTYVVSVRVTDDDNAVTGGPFTDVATTFVTIVGNPPPVARVSCSPTAAVAPFNFVCNGGDSFDPDPTNVIGSYAWSVNPAGLSSGSVSPSTGSGVIFSANVSADAVGTFIVTLTVTDDESLTDTEDVNFVVNGNPPPIAVATASPSFCTAPCDITLDGTGSSDPDSTNVITRYQWGITGPDTNYSVPGGVTVNGPADPPCTTPTDPATFAIHFNSNAAGVYTAELAVCDDDNLSDTVSVSLYINVNPPPVAIFTCDITTGITPFTVTCDASASYDPDNGPPGEGITDYRWDFTFHDTNNSVACDATYPTASSHINLGGDCDSNTSTADEGTGDFNTLPNTDDSEGARSGNIVTFTYTDSGLYTIFLKVTDDDGSPGNIGTASLLMTARDQPPSATIDVDPVACPAGPGVPCTFTLRANNSKDPDSATSPLPLYEWDFDYNNPLQSNDPDHITNLDFCYRTGTPFTVDAVGTQVEFATELHGLHIIALRVTDNDDQPWANDPDNDADNGQDNHACASVSVLVKNPDFPPTVKVDIARDLFNINIGALVRNAPWPENQDNPPPGWDPNDQAIPNDDEFLANPANCANNEPGCVQLAVWVEDPGVLGPTLTVAIDWDADGDETTQNFEYALCNIDPNRSGDVVAASNSANATTCGPHPTLSPAVTFSPFDFFVGSDGVNYFSPPIFTYTTSGRHHIIVLVCDSANPDDPLANCSEGDKTIESLKLHPAVEINYDLSGCADFDAGTEGSSTLDSTCVANLNILWNDPDGPPLGIDCPTCVVQVDCDFGDSVAQGGDGDGTLEWPVWTGTSIDFGDFSNDTSSNQIGEGDHEEQDLSCTYTDPARNTYTVVTLFSDDDSPFANWASATTTIVIRSTPPTIEIVHSEDDTIFDPDGGYDNNDDLVGNPATNWFFRVCADDSDDGAYADNYVPGGGGADATTKWIFWNYDALPGADGNDPVGSPFGYGDDDPVAGAGFDGSASTTGCVDITVPDEIYNQQGRYVFHVRVLDDECHLDGVNPDVDCDADNDGTPEPDNPAVNIGVNASDAWLTLIVVNEPPVIDCRLDSNSVQSLGEEPPEINTYTLTCEAQDPDGGNVTLDLNVDFNKGAAEDPADTYNPFGGIALPFDPATDCADDWSGAGAGYPQDWDFTGFINGFTQSWSYEEAGKYCIVVRATDDEGNTEDHILQVNVVDEPPKLEAQLIDTNNSPTGGPPDELDAVAPVNSNWWIRINAEDPDGIYNPGFFDTVRVVCPNIQVGSGTFDSGPVPYLPGFPTPIDIQIDGDPAAGIQPLTVAGQFTCDVSYTDDDSADPDGPNTTTIQVTLTVWSSTPTIDVQVWDDDNNDADPNRPCDRPGSPGPQTQNRYCRDAFADPSLGNRFFSFYVRADDEDGFNNSPGTPSINVSCPTIDTDPGAPGVQALNQTVVGPAFTVTSPPPESFTNTERIDLDFDTTAAGIQPATSDHAGQHTCTITYTDDEGDTESIDVTIVILGNTLPTVLIDVRPEATNPPAIFQPATHRRASSGFTERTPASAPFAPETNIFVFRASVFDQDEGQTELDCAYYGGPACNFTFEWDLNNDGTFETNTGNVPEVSVVYCDGFANGNASGNNWAAASGNADPGTPAACTNNGTPDQKLIKVGLRVTDDEGQTNTAWQTIALHDTAPWAEIDVANSGDNDLLVTNNSTVNIQLNGNDPDSPGEVMLYEFECGDDNAFDEFSGLVAGGTTQNVSITYGSASTCLVAPGSSVTGTLRITDEEGNVRTATTTISINNAAGSPPGVEIVVDATSNPLLDLNVCFAPCPVSATVFWEDTVGAGNLQSGTVNWGDTNVSNFGGGFVGSTTQTNTYVTPGVYTVTATVVDSDGNSRSATTIQIVLDRAPSADIDVIDAGGPVGSPGPNTDPRDNANALILVPNAGTVTLRADRNGAGNALDDDTFDYEYHPNVATPADATNNFQFDWWCDVNGDGIAQAGEIQSGINLTSVTYGPFPVGSTLRRCLLRVGDDERGGANGYGDSSYNQPFGLCGSETAAVACPANVSPPAGFAWNNDLWSAEAEVYVVVNDQPPSAYILEDGVGSPAGCPDQATTAGCPTPSLDDFSGHLDSSTTYTVDLRAYGVDADATYDGAGDPVSTPPIDRLIDCTDDGTFDSRFADQSTNLFDFTNFCVYSVPGSYNLRVRNITDLNDTDPITGAFGDATVSIVILDIAPSAYIMVDTDTSDPDNDGNAGNLNGVVNGTGEQFSVSLRAHGVDPDVHFGRPGAGDGDYGANTDDSFNRGVTSTWTVSPDGTCAPSPGDTTTCTWTTVGVKTITLRNTDTMGNTADATIVAVVFEWDPDANLCKDADPATPGCQIDPSILFGPPPLSIPLFGQASDIDDGGSITDYSWDCNYDGTFDGDSSGASNTFTCTYERCPEPAEFIIAMRATDDEGSTAWSMNSVVCFDKPPSADIDEDIGTAPPAAIDALAKAQNWNNPLWLYVSGGAGAPITLSGMGADEGAGPNNNVFCSWTSTGPAALTSTTPTTPQACSFAAPDQQDFEASVAGFYEVTLTVEDDEDNDITTTGNQSMARYPLVVFDYDPTISIKAAENAEGCPSGDDPNPTELVNGFNGFDSDGNPVNPDAFCFYTDNLSNPDGDPTPVTVSWDFDWSDAPASGGNNDGVLNEADCDGSGGIGAIIFNTYTSVGQFRVCAIATDSTNNTTFAHLTVEVNDGQSDGKPSDPYVNVNCQETPPVDPVVPLPFPPCPADDPTCVTRDPTLVDVNPAVFTCDAFADDPDDRTLGHQDPNGPDLAGSPHQSEEDGNPAGPDIVRYCWYIWQIVDAKTGPHTAFDPHQTPIADCDNEIVPDLDDLDTRTPVLRFVNTGAYYLEAHVFDEGNNDGDNFCDLDVTANVACVDGDCDTDVLTAPETNCAVGSITIFVTEQRPAAAFHKLDPSYGWPEGTGGFTTEVIGKTACLPPGNPQRRVGFHWSWGDGAFFGDDNPGYVCDPPLQEVHSNPAFHTYVSPGQFYILLSVRDIDTQAESQSTSTVVGTDWPIFP
ncbi:MAG: PKD domain-containing protein [bacterium JZ-2024 1]